MEKWLIGVDLGGTTTKFAILNAEGDILHKWQIETDLYDNGSRIIHHIAKSIDDKLAEINEPKSKIIGIGIGAPGPVRSKDGLIYEAINLGWQMYPLQASLGLETGLPVMVDNDANVAALGEMWKGAGQGARNLVCITLGTGVGGGVIVNGQAVHGISGAAGEIGHITVISENGSYCNCGKKGCLETVASATGIVRLAQQAMTNTKTSSLLQQKLNAGHSLSAKLVFDCAKERDPLSIEIVHQVSLYLGLALSHIGHLLNPEKIIIGGGVSLAGDILMEPIRAAFDQNSFKRVSQSTMIIPATLGNDAGVIGAGWLVKHRV